MKRKIFIPFCLLILPVIAIGQTRISNGGAPAAANADAILELTSTGNNKGLLMPQVALTAINQAAPLSAHVAGLTVYNTATAGTAPNNVWPGIYYNNGAAWSRVSLEPMAAIGDVKYGAQTADHNGWYLLNGRLKSSLPTNAQTNATNLGMGANIPDASDRLLKTNNGSETLNATGGGIIITQASLPNVTFTGTTSSAGDHSHTYTDATMPNWHVISGSANVAVSKGVSQIMTTGAGGAHSHDNFSIPSGGTGAAINYKPNYLVTNVFIYLGN